MYCTCSTHRFPVVCQVKLTLMLFWAWEIKLCVVKRTAEPPWSAVLVSQFGTRWFSISHVTCIYKHLLSSRNIFLEVIVFYDFGQDFHMLVANPRKQKLNIQVKDSLGFTGLTIGTGEVNILFQTTLFLQKYKVVLNVFFGCLSYLIGWSHSI